MTLPHRPWWPKDPGVRQAPRIKVSYPRRMTVCIAAQFNLGPPYLEEPCRAFVLCTDGRISGDGWAANDAAVKTHTLGHNFIAMMAGPWSPVRDLCSFLEADTQRPKAPKDKSDAYRIINKSVDRFCKSPLCPEGTSVACLITGFIGGNPVMFSVHVENGKATMSVQHDHWAIGEGAYLANTLLNHRGYDPLNADVATASYLVYEAKRFSEAVSTVGPKTWLKVHAPASPEVGQEQNTVCLMDISEAGVTDLEKWRTEYFLQPITQLRGRLFRRFLGQ